MKSFFSWRRWLKIYFVVNLLLAPIFLCIAVGFAAYSSWFLHRAVKVDGVVIGLEGTRWDANAPVSYSPVFKFALPDGMDRVVHSSTGSSPAGFSVGEHVPVVLMPSDPGGAKIESFGQVWGLALGFGIVSVVTAFVGLYGRFVVLRRRKFAEISIWPA